MSQMSTNSWITKKTFGSLSFSQNIDKSSNPPLLKGARIQIFKKRFFHLFNSWEAPRISHFKLDGSNRKNLRVDKDLNIILNLKRELIIREEREEEHFFKLLNFGVWAWICPHFIHKFIYNAHLSSSCIEIGSGCKLLK